MITTFKLEADLLDLSIVRSIKEAFKGKEIQITISDAENIKDEATLLKRIDNIKKHKKTTVFETEEFLKTYRKKIADAKNRVR